VVGIKVLQKISKVDFSLCWKVDQSIDCTWIDDGGFKKKLHHSAT
jgi:hypothetical protein